MNKRPNNNLGILWLIAMVMYTPIVAMCLNFSVFNPRIIPILLTWVILLLVPYVLIKREFLYKIAASLLFADGFINLFHWIILKCPLNASSIFVFMNTNFSEATEFMAIKMDPLLLLLIPYISVYQGVEKCTEVFVGIKDRKDYLADFVDLYADFPCR